MRTLTKVVLLGAAVAGAKWVYENTFSRDAPPGPAITPPPGPAPREPDVVPANPPITFRNAAADLSRGTTS